MYIYIIDTWKRIPKETDVIKPLWFAIDQLPYEQMWDDAKYWLPKALHGKHINATFLYDKDNRTVIEKSNESNKELFFSSVCAVPKK